MFKNYLKKIKEHRLFPLLASVVFIGICCVQYLTVEISAQNFIPILKTVHLYKLVGVATVVFLNILLLLIFKSLRTALNITNIITAVLSVANFYVYKLHGTPLNIDLLKNAATAMDVIGGYSFELALPVIVAFASAVAQFAVINVLFGKVKCKRIVSAAGTFIFAAVMIISYFTATPLVNKSIVGWSWKESMSIAGYIPCLVQSTQQHFNAVQQPERYNEADTKAALEQVRVSKDRTSTPDVILILNETLYDLNKITDTGVECFEYINSLENAVTGYALAPSVGGGTNKSEYELLTSNTLSLAPNVTPFNVLDFENTNSIARYFKTLGYTTLATHPAEAKNYNREKTYPKLGFDAAYYEDSYSDTEFFADRYFETDESVYKNVIRMYEQMGEGPRFIYLLTIQNHGGYTLNDADMATVRTTNDYGSYTHNVNEFLSCMQLSDNAFKYLVDYFENIERDVIVCMVGDHSPDFAVNVVSSEYSQEEKDVLLRSMPYVIWSNSTDLTKYEQNADTIGMVSIVPTMIDTAQIKPSEFYAFISNLNDRVPVLTAYGRYITKDGTSYSYKDAETAFTQEVDMYLNFCYANMKNKDFMLNAIN